MTGANGSVGRRLVPLLCDAGLRVRALMRDRDSASWPGLAVERVEWEATDPSSLRTALSGTDAVCHTAAFIPQDHEDSACARQCLEVNALGTLALLEESVEQGLSSFVHFSTGNIYWPQSDLVSEDAPIYPSNHASYYLASKVCADTWASHILRTGRLDVSVLRPSAVYGMGTTRGVVAAFVERLRREESIRVRDGGLYRSDLVYVDDVGRAAVSALTNRATGVFNVGSGQATTTLELAATLVSLLDCNPALVEVEPASSESGAGGFAALDIKRARAELGYAPLSLRAGLARMLSSNTSSER